MKQFLILVTIVIACSFASRAQYVTIPDPNFKAFLLQNYPASFNGSQMMDTTSPAIVNEASLSLFGAYSVTNWDGFQYFKNLQVADFSSTTSPYIPALPNTLKKLDVSSGSYFTVLPSLPNGLIYLNCRSNGQLTSLPVLPNSLQHLDCSGIYQLQPFTSLPASLQYLNITDNSLFTFLPALPATLDTLIAEATSLNSLPALPTSMKVLICPLNMITTLPALPAQLRYLNCSNNLITSLPTTLPAQLEYMNVSRNQVGNMPPLPSTLTYLSFDLNVVPSLPALPSTLTYLSCYGNLIPTMPTLPVGLQFLFCGNNQLTSLPALPSTLTLLDCGSNQLPALPALPQSLLQLFVGGNLLTGIPSLPNNLVDFECGSNQLGSLPPLPAHLEYLACPNNPLYFLPALPNTLRTMYITGCPNLTCLPVLPQPVGAWDIYMDNTISCVPNITNYITFDVSDTAGINPMISTSNYPLCSAVNNIHHCDAFPLMTGYAYYDNNNNLIKDANEPYRANVRVQLSNGAYTITNSDGYYQIPADSIGNYTLTVTTPNFFTSVPLQYSYNFSTYDTLVTGNFAFHAITVADSVAISIIPVNGAARPGFSYPLLIAYENDGTSTISPNIIFNYDNTRLLYDSSSNASVINTGNSLTLSETGFVAGQQKSFIGYFRVNAAAVIGDSLRSGAHITGGSAASHDSDVVAIRGSYDPNDKSATPNLMPAQVTNGDYIYYTIRFQNTGTDTAFSIVVTDTLNNKLQASTMQMIATSHPCITTVKGNTISFEFINIQLPDSNVNQLKSHGYISFRIKPQNSLVVNDIVPNKAAIYFDYNSPVITNTAITTVIDPIVVPLKLLSFTVSRGVGQSANLSWQTSNEVSVQQYEIEMSTNGRTFTTIGFEIAKGFQYNSYTRSVSIPSSAVLYFRLKMIDIDGRYTYSNVAILKNDKANNAFSFFNNPVKDELSILLQDESLRNTTAIIYNAQGVKAKTILLQHDVENVNIKSLPAGTYYLVTEKGSGQFVVVR